MRYLIPVLLLITLLALLGHDAHVKRDVATVLAAMYMSGYRAEPKPCDGIENLEGESIDEMLLEQGE